MLIGSNLMLSGGGQRPEDPEDADLQAVRGGEPDRTPPRRQKAEVRHQVQECQQLAQVQRDLPLVSILNLPGLGSRPYARNDFFLYGRPQSKYFIYCI
jgi:hypothetical protein